MKTISLLQKNVASSPQGKRPLMRPLMLRNALVTLANNTVGMVTWHNNHGWLLVITLTVLLNVTQRANAEVRVDVFSSIGTTLVNQKLVDNSFVQLGPIEPMGTNESGFGHARAGTSPASLLQVTANTSVHNGSNIRSMITNASWQDILFLDGPTPPDTVRLNFEIDGQLAVSPLNGGTLVNPDVSRASLYITALNRFVGSDPPAARNTGPPPAEGFQILVESMDDGSGTVHTAEALEGLAQEWFTSSLTTNDSLNYDFHGTFGIVTPRRDRGDEPDGYLAALGITAVSTNRNANSETDFFGTIKLTSITNEDGSPLPDGLNLSFDSGLIIPEPTTALLLASFGFITTVGRIRQDAT